VRIFTTAGVTACAMRRNVSASIGPSSGALLTAGLDISISADEAGDRSSRDAMTIPTASEAIATSTV
jgi:hypothetical protein